ncbi:SIP domain-containing protein [Kribbella sp. NPDC051586]|uniref:SIP domain-containing protein n=1 Tax=Kribbella sp. NPDC051586 TaxID=3364118 RepID=UPI003792E762
MGAALVRERGQAAPARVHAGRSGPPGRHVQPATIWFETTHDLDQELPFRTEEHHELRTVPRSQMVDHVKADLEKLITPDTFVWIACDTATTRALTSYVLKDLAVPKHRVKSLGYWKAA